MPLKIRPNAIEQEEGDFIFPGVISLVGTTEFTFDADGVTGSSLVSGRDTTSGLKTPVTIRGSAIHLVGNEDLIALRVEEGGGQGWLRINPTAKDYDLSYLADDGTVLLYGDAGSGRIGIGTDAPQRKFVVSDTSPNIGMKSQDGRGWSLYAPGGGLEPLYIWAHHNAGWTAGEYKLAIYPSGSFVWNPFDLDRDFEVRAPGGVLLFSDASSHRVGIGTNAPNRLLEISNQSGEAYIRIDGNSGSAVQLEYYRDGNYAWVGPTAGGEFHLWNQEVGAMVFGVGNAEVMRATSDGYLGIGTIAPTHQITLVTPVGGGFTQRNTRVVTTEDSAGAAFDLVLRTTGTIGVNHGPGFLMSVQDGVTGPNYIAGVYGRRTVDDVSGHLGFWTRNTGGWSQRAFLDHDGLHFQFDEMGLLATGTLNIRPSGDIVMEPGGNPILGDDKYFQFGQFTTGSAAWPAEPAASDWIIFGQDMADSFDGITPYFRCYGAGPWEYPQPLISRSYEDYRVTDSWHAFGDSAYYIAGQVNATALTSGAPAINEIHFIPFFVNQRFVVTKLGFYVTVAGSAGSVARVGIYNNKRIRDSGPNNLLYDGGEKSTTSTGAKETTGLSVELVPGMYWFAYHPGVAAPTIRCLAAGAIFPNWGLSSLSNTNIQVGRIGDSTYGALPALGYGLAGSALSTTDPIPAIYFTLN